MELGHVAAIYIKYYDCLEETNLSFPSVYKYKDWIKFVDEQLDDDDTVYEIYDTDSLPRYNSTNNNQSDYYSFYNDYDIDYVHDMNESAQFLAQDGNYPDYFSSIAENKLENMILLAAEREKYFNEFIFERLSSSNVRQNLHKICVYYKLLQLRSKNASLATSLETILAIDSQNAIEIKEQSMLKKLPNEVTQRHPVYNAI
uniref:Uncharacterized protein n=1 Tax=Glossina palpalis gambiensis TaxID=67801 RepID=A0A1B0BLU2_9MUSC